MDLYETEDIGDVKFALHLSSPALKNQTCRRSFTPTHDQMCWFKSCLVSLQSYQ